MLCKSFEQRIFISYCHLQRIRSKCITIGRLANGGRIASVALIFVPNLIQKFSKQNRHLIMLGGHFILGI